MSNYWGSREEQNQTGSSQPFVDEAPEIFNVKQIHLKFGTSDEGKVC